MKKILIVADGILAKNFLRRLHSSKISEHEYLIISDDETMGEDAQNLENFTFRYFDATSLSKLKSAIDGYFSQFCVVSQNRAESFEIYENLRKISTKTDLVFMNLWQPSEREKERFLQDKHLDVVDVRDITAARLMDCLPDVPVFADNIGLIEGEIMEVKVPVGSAYMYRRVGQIKQKKWRIALIYRGGEILMPKPAESIRPGDTLLLTGEPSVLQNVYRAIKRESGQFPSPFGSNIYAVIDMRLMSEARVAKIIDDSLFLHEKLKNKRLFFKVLNPTLGKNLDRLKALDDKNIAVLTDYFSKNNSKLASEIPLLDVGLVVCDDGYFSKFKTVLYALKLPVLKLGVKNLKEVKQSVILGSQGDEIENQSAVIVDCCAQLQIEVKFYHFDSKNSDKTALAEHFESLSEIFSKRISIESSGDINPLVKLKNEKDLLHFVVFDEKIANDNKLAFLSADLNRLYKILGKNAQLFVPTSA